MPRRASRATGRGCRDRARRARRGARAPGAAVGVRQAGIVDFARGLSELGVELVSTGGTARELADAGIAVRAIEDFTGFPEIMDGRVKTLHPRLYAGLLARRDDEAHLEAAARAGDRAGRPRVREPVSVRADDRARRRRARRRSIENIDIGGPTMIRAAAKNSAFAAVVVDPEDYGDVLDELRASEGASRWRRRKRWRPRRSRAPPATTPRSRRWFAARTYEGFPPTLARRLREGHRPALRREPPPAAAFYARVGAPTHLLDGRRAAARQGAVVQQPARPQLRARAGRGVRRARVRDRQAQQPVRLRGRRERPGGLRARLRVRPAERLRRRDRAQPAGRRGCAERCRAVHRGAARARLRRGRAGDAAARRRTCACWSWRDWPRAAATRSNASR